MSLSPCSNSKILVNGKLVNGTVTLHHNDRYVAKFPCLCITLCNIFMHRIILGCHHLYVLNHPREVRSLPVLSGGGHNKLITYRQALEDIAVCSGYTAGIMACVSIVLPLTIAYKNLVMKLKRSYLGYCQWFMKPI